jgi:hypothetical protein
VAAALRCAPTLLERCVCAVLAIVALRGAIEPLHGGLIWTAFALPPVLVVVAGARSGLATAERIALLGMVIGVELMIQPWWAGGMRAGFFATAAFALGHIVVSHLPERRP